MSDWIIGEARRCLDCFEPPCMQACPVSIPVPEFIRSIRSGNIKRAAGLVRQANPMAAICGEVCPEEVFCQSACTRGKIDRAISIRELHRFATGREKINSVEPAANVARVAIIGSGPAGLACAAALDGKGIKAVIFEKTDRIGGVPAESIPLFRLSNDSIGKDIGYIQDLCTQIETNSEITTPESLLGQYEAIFIAAGLDQVRKLNIPGENLPGVMGSLEFLESARNGNVSSLSGRQVVVIGGGNVSLDVAAMAAQIGAAEVRLTYRRGPKEMRAWKSELVEAEKLGVVIDYLTSPVEFLESEGNLSAVKCQRTSLIDEYDPDGRRRVEQIADSGFILPADLAIIAVGIVSNFRRDIAVAPNLTTSMPGIFAGGDWARGEGTIVEAVRDGKIAAGKIAAYLRGGDK